MARAGDTIENRATRERIVFRQVAADTGGDLLELEDTWVRPEHRVPEHVHPGMEERFELVSGAAMLNVAGVEHGLRVGEPVSVPPGAPHRGWNVSGGETVLLLQFRPALRWEEVAELLFKWAAEGRTDEQGTPEPALGMQLLRDYPRELALP